MKIITRFESAWDEVQQRYVTVSEDSYEYVGPIARCDFGGGGSSTTTTNVPPKTETELAVDELTLKQLKRQDELFEKYKPIIEEYIIDYQARQKARTEAGMTPEAAAKDEVERIARDKRMGKISEDLANLQLEAVKNAGKPTPEQITSIDAATGAAQRTGEADIERFRTATLRQINEEVASASGLRPTDTPILRLSERAGEESARQQGQLTSKLAETNATARLNFPLASAKLTSDIAGQQQSLAEASRQFSEQLNMRAQDNRLRLFAGGSQPQVSSVGFGASMANERFRGASTTTNTEKGMGLGDWVGIAGGIGGLMRSDRRLKRDIYRLGELPSGIPIYIFRFIGFEDWHVGVMADEVMGVIPEAVVEDNSGFLLVNYAALH